MCSKLDEVACNEQMVAGAYYYIVEVKCTMLGGLVGAHLVHHAIFKVSL